jgi:hypothetical protein
MVEIDRPERLVEEVGQAVAALGDRQRHGTGEARAQLGEIEQIPDRVQMLGTAVPVAGIVPAAPAIPDHLVRAIGDDRLEARAALEIEPLIGVHQRRPGLVDGDAVIRMKGARPGPVRQAGIEGDAAALVVEALHGELEGCLPDLVRDPEREGRADPLDLDHVLARLVEAAEVQRQHVGLVVVEGEVAGCVPGLVQPGRTPEHHLARAGLEEAKGRAGRIGDGGIGRRIGRVVAEPHREIAGLDRVVRAKADMADMHGLAPQPGRVVGQGRTRHRRMVDGDPVGGPGLEGLCELEEQVVLDDEAVLVRRQPRRVDDLGLPPDGGRPHGRRVRHGRDVVA